MKTILVVEDERIVARDLQFTLERQGYAVSGIAATSDEAIASASQRCPDLVLMDIHIKGERDGIETARLLHDRFRVPVVYLTAYADEETVERAKITRPYGYLIKPFNERELRSAIEIATYKHEMETRLAEQQRWFATTLRSIGDAVLASDAAGHVVFMNAAAETLLGCKEDAARGQASDAVLKLTDPATGTNVEDPIRGVIARRHIVQLSSDVLLAGADGRTWAVEACGSPIVGEDGALLGAVLVLRDVSERRRLQQQIELTERLASLGTIAAGIAHEINNPLAAVFGNIDFVWTLICRLVEDVRTGRFVLAEWNPRLIDLGATIEDTRIGAERIRAIVDDMRLFSRAQEPRRQPLDVRKSIEWAMRMTAGHVKPRARVVQDIRPVALVEASEVRLGQVLANLIVNAAQAMPDGALDRSEIRIATYEAGGRVVIDVADNGSGIPAEQLKRIFDPFFTTRPVGVGTGLGLSICHGIVSSLGGDLTVESTVGEGSCFRIALPLAAAGAGPPASDAAAPGAARVRNARILVIDDDSMVARSIERTLRDQHQVTCITQPRLAIDAIKAGAEFDLILCDLMMPKTNGVWVYEQLLAIDPALADRLIFVSGALFIDEMQAFLASVPNRRLEKPFSPRDLLELVEGFLGQHGKHS